MYQVCLSIAQSHESWLSQQDELLTELQQLGGVYACVSRQDRLYFSFACSVAKRPQLESLVKEYLCELYLTKVKKQYMKQNIKIHLDIFDILLSILVGFDRDSERELLDKLIVVHENIAIDGYFNFRLTELKSRWMDICTLAKENAFFLTDRETMFELLRFLMSTIKPKIDKIVVKQQEDGFGVYTLDDSFLVKFESAEDLLLYFIETAPLEIRIMGDILPSQQRAILDSIFDDKLKA
ncbi:MAG: hypothetical protein LBK70_02820 [Clostridiales bacterium]|jgi:hypothetical protein|nr:hypothetical protein [Clostridiales bacterium]